MLIKRNDTNYVEWSELSASQYSGSTYRFYLPTNYDVSHTLDTSVQYIWKLTTVRAAEASGKYNGFVTQAWDDVKMTYETIDGSTVK